MNLQTEKLEIVRMLLSTNDQSLIREVKALFRSRQADWWDEVDEQQKQVILEGLAQADRGQTVPHQEAVKMFGKWGLK